MSGTFDAKVAAHNIEEAGKTLLHGDAVGVSFAALLGDMGKLNPQQANELTKQIQWDNMKPNGLPNVDVSLGVDGQITGFTFTPALSDVCPNVSPFIMVGSGHKDSGVPAPSLEPAPHKKHQKRPEFQH